MKFFFAFLFCFFAMVIVYGQDTLSKEGFPKKGDQFPVKSITLTKTEIPYLLFYTGVGHFNYDLSYLNPTTEGFDLMEDPKNLQGGDQVKAADYGFAYNYGTAFFKNENDAITMVGLSPKLNSPIPLTFVFDSNVVFMQAPVMFGQKVIDSSTSRLQIPFFYDINANMKCKYEVNGYGKLTIPGDTTFDVLRVKRVLTFTAFAKELLSGVVDTITDSLVTWEFYAKDYASTILRVEISLETVNNQIDTLAIFTFSDQRSVGTKTVSKPDNYYNTYFSGQKLITNSSTPTTVFVYNIGGQLMSQSNHASNQHQIDLSYLPKGNYLILQISATENHTEMLYKSE